MSLYVFKDSYLADSTKMHLNTSALYTRACRVVCGSMLCCGGGVGDC